MKRKTIYILCGVIVFILIVIISSKPEQSTVQEINQNVAVQENNGSKAPNSLNSVNTKTVDTKIDSIQQIQSADETKNPTTDNEYVYYSISKVVDGDTIKININGKEETFRLIGIDTPETVDPRKVVQCFGVEASNKAKELLSGKKVRIETDSSQGTYDKYDRLLGYIYREDGLFYNKYMIEQGYAHEYTYSTPYKYQKEFKNAQKEAQDNNRGLWSPNTCNGDTTGTDISAQTTPTTAQSSGQFYTSSYGTAKYYYPASCTEWESLSPKYLKAFDSLENLLLDYPSRTKSPQCN
jgi:endonuclease YncB( thermonuclease family)